ncbi:MAG: hypothetical protein J6J01_04110 [Oscillospiraceae bacterium]|nr:hypothetical protein [Clostridia bacterium]MBP3698654.1 hypothetical protein [Oscillospiraceae bacterium]
MKHKTKLLAMAMTAVILFTAVSLASCDPGDLFSDTEAETTASETAESLHIEPEKSPFITVSVSPVTVAVTNNQPTLKQTLTATIKPATTANKEVDWTVAWADSTGVGDVTDYITVTPESDGSTNATVTCYKPFTGDIVITVITRDGGFTARCLCNYVGKPTSLVIEPTGATMVSDSDWNIRVAEVKSGNTYLFDLLPSNVFGSVSESYTTDYTVSIQTHGGINTTQKNYDSAGTLTGTVNGTVELTVADLMESQGYCYAYFPKTGGIHTFLTVRIENGKLKIEAQEDPASFTWTTGNQLGKATCTFDGYTDDKLPFVTVTVTEKNSGLTQTIHVRTVSAVQSVSLSRSRMSF